jgi:hypothetical protein
VGGLGELPSTFFDKPAPGAGTNVVTGCVTVPTPSAAGGCPRAVAVPVKLLVTLVPETNVADGKVTFRVTSQLLPGVSGSAHGLVQVTVAGVVPSQPGSQSAAGDALLKTVPGGRVSVIGPTAVRFSVPSAPELLMRRR